MAVAYKDSVIAQYEIVAIDNVIGLADWRHLDLDCRSVIELSDLAPFTVFVDLDLFWILLTCSTERARRDPQNLELRWVVLVEEGDRDAHRSVVVSGDRIGERHFDRGKVIVPVV